MSFEDKTLVCRDCGNEFTFTAGEQEFYAQKGFTNEPQRCRNCRQARKQQRGDNANERPAVSGNYRSEGYARSGNEYGGSTRGNEPGGGYNRSSDYGNSAYGNEYSRGNENDRGNAYGNTRNGNDYGGGYGTEGYGSRERVQHETVCAQCGRPTTVPFVPRAGRPVYCQECFAQRRGSLAGRGPSRDNNFNRF